MPSPSRAPGYSPPAHPDFFVQTPVSVVRCRGLTPIQKTTYEVLLSYADADGCARPGQLRLAAEVGCSERTIRTALQALAAAGLVAVRRRGQGWTNVYQLTRIPLRTARRTADRHSLPVQSGRPCRAKAAPAAPESDPVGQDPVKQDQPPAAHTPPATGTGGGATAAQIEADAVLITQATGMALDEAQATAQAAAVCGHGPGYVAELVAHVTNSPSVQNPAGCLRALVQGGKRRPPRGAGGVPPRAQRAALHPEHYSPSGKYAHLFHRAGVAPTAGPPPPIPTRRGPSAFEIAANPLLAGRGAEAWPRGQPLPGP